VAINALDDPHWFAFPALLLGAIILITHEKIAVIGLGYVGLPVAVSLGRRFENVVGFDINVQRVEELCQGFDRTSEVSPEQLAETRVRYTHDPEDMRACTFFIVAVPTPIDHQFRPDLMPLQLSSQTVGRVLKKGDVVVYESTVYPGVTEQFCGPILAKTSGLAQHTDFHLGYSPERINPGDHLHTFERITKVVSADSSAALERVAAIYGAVVEAGIFRATSIRAAEAAKVIENTQRDLNIALMNELALIFNRIGLRTKDVLDAAKTKWNFLPFEPGLVGGHCIGVDPYYLTTLAEEVGYHPEIILAGRRINEGMSAFVVQQLVKLLINNDQKVKNARVAILGLTFKPDIRDLRNTKVIDIIKELKSYGISALVHDPMAISEEVEEHYGFSLTEEHALRDLDAIIFAVPHKHYLQRGPASLCEHLKPQGVFLDVKSAFSAHQVPQGVTYWSL
jgi:UDP-N-acetyl-D-galactosamine dehydrogenase